MAEPGFFGSLANTMQSPLFLGGVGLLSGGGMQGMSQGIQTGILGQRQQFDQEQQRLDRMRQQQQDAENMRRWNTTDARAAETHPLHLAQMKAQTQASLRGNEPEIVRTMRAAGINPNSPEGQQLIRNSIKGGGPIDQAVARMMEGMGRQAPQPGQMPSPQQGGITPQSYEGGGDQGGIVPVQTAPQPVQPSPQQGGIIPQSYEGGGDQGGIVPVQTAPQPVQPSPVAPSQEPMVNTPMGPMPKQQADMLGFALAMQGKGDAGKMLTGADALGKEAGNQNDKAGLNSIEQSSRLDAIVNKFKPEYQTYDYQLKNWTTSKLDSIGATRGAVTQEARQKMAEYTQFKQDALNNLSAYIKEITGAAMGVQEEKRIRGGMPDPEKDSPVEFEAKMKNSIATAKLALARHAYLKRNGYDDGSLSALAKGDKLGTVHSIDDMKSIINGRLRQAEQQIKAANPNMPQPMVDQHLRQLQRREFGI